MKKTRLKENALVTTATKTDKSFAVIAIFTRPESIRQRAFFWLFLLCVSGLCSGLRPAAGQNMVSAADLLQRAAQAEEKALAKDAGPGLTRFYQLEKHALGNDGATRYTLTVTRQAQSGKTEIFRLYDATGQLVAGDWRTANTRKLYRMDAIPAVTTAQPADNPEWVTLDTLLLVKPGAAALRDLLAASTQTVVAETAEAYLVTCQFAAAGEPPGLIKARLTLRRTDNQVAAQVFLFEGKEEITEYRILPLSAPPVTLLPDIAAVAQIEQEMLPAKAAPPAPDTPASARDTPKRGLATEPIVPAGPLNVGLLMGRAVRQPAPIYPELARRYRLGGTVTIYLELNEKGSVAKIIRVEGPALLQSAAADTARKWTFIPTLVKGQAVRVTGYITFTFKS